MKNSTTIDMPSSEQILTRLSALTQLPNFGMLAGGAVANTILSILDGKDYPVHDFDIFVRHSSTEQVLPDDVIGMDEDLECFKEPFSVDVGTTTVLAGDSYTPESIAMSKFYGVYSSYRVGLMNYVVIAAMRGSDDTALTLEQLLDAFDINACQAGIDLATGELVTTAVFRDFIKTRQLRIHHVSTPFRSAIRLAKKQRDLGAYCDLKEEISMLATANSEAYYATGVVKGYPLGVSETLYAQYELVQDALAGYLEGTWEKSYYPDDVEHGADADVPFELREPDLLEERGWLEFPEDLIRYEPRMFVAGLAVRMNQGMYPLAFRRVWDGMSRIHTPGSVKQRFAAVKDAKHVGVGVCCFDNFLGNDVSPKKVSRIEKFLKGHDAWLILKLGETLDDVYTSVKVLESLGPDGLLAVGALEAGSIKVATPFCKEAVLSAVATYLKSLGDGELVSPFPVPARLQSERVVIRELTTAVDFVVEGAKMRHCVAGYARVVKDGMSRIFHLEVDGRPSTLEIDVSFLKRALPCIAQHKGPRNQFVSEEEEQVAQQLFKCVRLHYLLKYPLIFLSTFGERRERMLKMPWYRLKYKAKCYWLLTLRWRWRKLNANLRSCPTRAVSTFKAWLLPSQAADTTTKLLDPAAANDAVAAEKPVEDIFGGYSGLCYEDEISLELREAA